MGRLLFNPWFLIGLMVVVGIPSIVLRWQGIHPDPVIGALIFGFGILSAAFLLSWGAETAELDISQGFALAIIAFIAVLPEYAVDLVLAWEAGADPEVAERGLAIANMTGGNRLLIGVGWPLVFALFFFRTRIRELVVDRQRSLELVFLFVATVYALLIPLRDSLALYDSVFLVGLFIAYLVLTTRAEGEEPELVGPAEAMGRLAPTLRRTLLVFLLIYSATVIFSAAEPFAESLIQIGEEFGVSEFLLIQWLAPLASESPELLVAGLLAWRGRAAVGMGALISSKVNQWTLLIGTLPIAFAISSGEFDFAHGLPLDARQREEILLTAAQSAFAIAVFLNLRMGRLEALGLFILFATQLVITNQEARIIYSFAYIALCIVLLIWHNRDILTRIRDAIATVREPHPGQHAEPLGNVSGEFPQPGEDRSTGD